MTKVFSAFSGGGQSGSGPMAGMAGMGLGALPMNPALVAAALNQAGWGLIGNLGGGGAPGGAPAGAPGAGDHAGFPTPTSFPATVAPGPTTVANSGTSNGSAAGFLGWGASPGAGEGPAGAGAGQSQQTTPPQHGPAAAAAAAAGTWSNQPRDRQGKLYFLNKLIILNTENFILIINHCRSWLEIHGIENKSRNYNDTVVIGALLMFM